MEPLLKSRDVAALLGVSPSTLSRWRDRKEGPPWVDVGGMPRYELEDVARWVKDVTHERY
jgi:predicted DNA-binding transcriptional regulator AlpA